MTLVIGALVLLAGLLWLMRSRSTPDPDARDQDVLNEAESEVQDLDAMASPEDADDALPDRGPGTARPDRR